jgi:hypothetical protein
MEEPHKIKKSLLFSLYSSISFCNREEICSALWAK